MTVAKSDARRLAKPLSPSNGPSRSKTHPLDASELSYSYTKFPKPVPNEDEIATSGTTICTDHMICVTWREDAGWSAPELKPYGPLHLMPTASCLHYATECFEGMKVYRGYDGKLRLFRPERNCSRLGVSAARISLPLFEPQELQKLILALIAVDGAKWLPHDCAGDFLYIRPTIIGTQPQLGVQAPREALMYILMSFMPRLHTIPGGMRLRTSPGDMVRAWTGGFGFAKIGANYGPSVVALQNAQSDGFHQVLWLYGDDGECTEAGGSNFFVVWMTKDGKKELVTAPLNSKLILDGITRQCCVDLARAKLSQELVVTERRFTIGEVLEAASDGRLLEAFSVGTAVS